MDTKKTAFPKRLTLTFAAVFVLVMLNAFALSLFAGGMPLEMAISHGLENNYELERKREEIRELQRQRDVLRGETAWKFGVNGSYRYDSEGVIIDNVIFAPKHTEAVMSLEGSKSTFKGFSINSRLSLLDNAWPFEFGLQNAKYEFEVALSQRLLPMKPSTTEREIIKLDNELSIVVDELALLEKGKELEWLQGYLGLLRLQERLEYSSANVQLVTLELRRLEMQFRIGESGKEQLLMAEIALKEADMQNRKLKDGFMQMKQLLEMDLGLEQNLALKADSSYVEAFIQRVESIDIELDYSEIEKVLEEHNPNLKKISQDKDFLEDALMWQLKEGPLKMDAFGGYHYNSNNPILGGNDSNWEIGIAFSYEFCDGGRRDLIIEGVEDQIQMLEKEYMCVAEQLKQQLNGMLGEYRIDIMDCEVKRIALEKTRLENAFFKQQYENGLINEIRYKQHIIVVDQAEIDLQEAIDTLLFTKAKIALFLGIL